MEDLDLRYSFGDSMAHEGSEYLELCSDERSH
jgi:hypothetical protein